MPELVRTPEQVLRETQQDVYLIRFNGWSPLHPKPDIPGRDELRTWFKENLPNIELEDLGPSEFSGVVIGGIGSLMRVGFDDVALARYVSAWENPDGSSRDARWSCFLYSYGRYLKHLAKD